MNLSRRSRANRGPSVGRHRLIFLSIFAAAFLLVPAAQSFGAETPHVKVKLSGTGSGEVTNFESPPGKGTPALSCSYDGTSISGVCENTPEETGEGFFVEYLRPIAAPGSVFAGWTVQHGSPGLCEPTGTGIYHACLLYNEEENEDIEWEATAEFTAMPFHLKVNVNGGSGAGTVTSSPAGINCAAGSECTAELSGATTLTAAPASGYVVAGWIGCKQTSPTTCSVVPAAEGEEKEVTAILLKEGKEGKEGKQGKEGSAGAAGAAGAQGAQGAKGDPGAAGAQGSAGAQGPAGPQGKQGPAGKVTVSCKVTNSKKVTCTVKQAKASASSRRLRWSLRHAGHPYRHGSGSGAQLHLSLGGLAPGRYRLHISGQPGNDLIVVG